MALSAARHRVTQVFALIGVRPDLLELRNQSRLKTKTAARGIPAAAVNDLFVTSQRARSHVPSLIRYSLGFSVSGCDSGSLLEARNVVLRHDVRIARRGATLAGRICVDSACFPVIIEGRAERQRSIPWVRA